MREYSDMLHAVLSLHDLRFKVVTVYVIGTFTSLFVALPFAPLIGFSIAIGQTALMFFLDYTLQERQVLFSLKAAKLEKLIYRVRGDNIHELSEGFFNMYLLEKLVTKRIAIS
jgi:hypothetical protein